MEDELIAGRHRRTVFRGRAANANCMRLMIAIDSEEKMIIIDQAQSMAHSRVLVFPYRSDASTEVKSGHKRVWSAAGYRITINPSTVPANAEVSLSAASFSFYGGAYPDVREACPDEVDVVPDRNLTVAP